MDICSGNRYGASHDEIVYDCGQCPLCAEIENRKEVEKERDDLQQQLDNIE